MTEFWFEACWVTEMACGHLRHLVISVRGRLRQRLPGLADNVNITIRARRDWIARLDAAADSVGESRMAYIRRAVDERMAREGHHATGQ